VEERLRPTRRVWGTCCTSPPQLADDAFVNQEQSGAARRLKQDLVLHLNRNANGRLVLASVRG